MPGEHGTGRCEPAGQVRGALLELLRGVGDDAAEVEPRRLHRGLIAVILRIVFLRLAAARGLLRAEAPAGAWAGLVASFRRIHGARGGALFDPAAHPFLERARVADEVVARALARLGEVGGEVERLGSIYEETLGDTLGRAVGPCLVTRAEGGVVELAELLSQGTGERARWLKERAGWAPAGEGLAALRAATTVEAAAAALARKGTVVLAPGTLYLQPGQDRRRSGSHYTPRALCGPIVETALRPVLARFGARPTAAQILSLAICDPAMGSGAFLIEAGRQLAGRLVEAWLRDGEVAAASPEVHARARQRVAERCLYGVDRDPIAVELARLSLWLEAGAEELPFSFVDHALRCGDSLVGLTRAQIEAFRWDEVATRAGESADPAGVKVRGDAIVRAFFRGERERERERGRVALAEVAARARAGEAAASEALRRCAAELRGGDRPVLPFHWEVEYPAIFGREAPGFDCVIGNPPFMGGVRISSALSPAYLAYITAAFPGAGGQTDLAAYFFRRGFALLREGGTLGFLSTNTVSQGDTRKAGLLPILRAGGSIYAARRRVRWEGAATVLSSVVWIVRGAAPQPAWLDGRAVPRISAFLRALGGDADPARLRENAGIAFKGMEPYGDGFVFEDGNAAANSREELRAVLARDPRNAARIFPYLGGQELNASPRQEPTRHVIDFGEATLAEAAAFPDLLAIAEARVLPERRRKAADVARWPWWQFWRARPELRAATRGLTHVLALADTSKHLALARVPATYVLNKTLVVLALDRPGAFCVLQSRVHEAWARCFGSSMRDDLRYTPSDCFETFPLPIDWRTCPRLAAIGECYERARGEWMVGRGEGLTALYNRFHDPEERAPAIARLRALHEAMDRAVLAAYGWDELATRATAEFRPLHAEDDGRRGPWRLRWPQGLHDEVLARLLALNAQRAAAGG